MKLITRRRTLQGLAGIAAASTIGTPAILRAADTIKLGFLSGLTGLETILGETQLHCFELGVEELNAANGIGGRMIEYVVEDDQTTTRGAIEKARKLVFEDQVAATMGMIASLEHVAARSVTSPANHILMYSCYYEGGVCENSFFSTGQVPNQQIVPSLGWLTENLGKSTYVIGSDYIWPRNSTDVIKAEIERLGGSLLGAEFAPFGTQDFAPIFDRARAAKPDFIWMMVAGADLITALKQYQSFGFEQQLFSNALDEVFSFAHPELTAGTLSNQAYFMKLDTPQNKAFTEAFAKKYGADKPINAIGEAVYDGLYLYAAAVEKAGTTDSDAVIKALREVEFDAPQGKVNFAANNCLRSNSILARGTPDGHWETVVNFGQIDPDVPGCTLG